MNAFVDGKQATHTEEHERHNKRPEINLLAMSERMFHFRSLLGFFQTQKQQSLIAAIGIGVNGLGQHRARTGDDCRNGFGDGNPQISQQGKKY